jgi:hypothetical protein
MITVTLPPMRRAAGSFRSSRISVSTMRLSENVTQRADFYVRAMGLAHDLLLMVSNAASNGLP